MQARLRQVSFPFFSAWLAACELCLMWCALDVVWVWVGVLETVCNNKRNGLYRQ